MVRPHYPVATSLPLDLSEAVFQSRVVELSRWCGWSLSYHALHSRGSAPGWPDLTLGRPRRAAISRVELPLPELDGRAALLFAELKTERGRVTPPQMGWLEHLHACGLMVALWRPSDWPEIVEVLAGRATPTWPPRRRMRDSPV